MIEVPLLDDAALPLSSNWLPVTPVFQPAGAARSSACWTTGPRLGPPNPVTGGVYTSANVDRPSLVRNALSCVVA